MPSECGGPEEYTPPIATLNCKRIAVLSANPIGENYDYTELKKALASLKCDVSLFSFSIATLNELENFDYIFILSTLIKNKIMIEDEALQSARIGFKELEENIGNSSTAGVFIFLNHRDKDALAAAEISDDIASLQLPTLIFPALDKQQINSFGFQIFKKNRLDYVENCIVVNPSGFRLCALNGKTNVQKNNTRLPDAIDPKNTQHYVGRKTDLQNICRKIVELQNNNEILTIKGSGGIGKTSTIKKIVVALAERNMFYDGIDFIDCEFIGDYQAFLKKIASNFYLENAIEIKQQIKRNFSKSNKLIILDNVETLLHLDDAMQIKELIYFIPD